MGFHRETVSSALERAGVSRRYHQRRDVDLDRADELHAAGLSIADVAKTLGIGSPTGARFAGESPLSPLSLAYRAISARTSASVVGGGSAASAGRSLLLLVDRPSSSTSVLNMAALSDDPDMYIMFVSSGVAPARIRRPLMTVR